jgi:hypothetical protein
MWNGSDLTKVVFGIVVALPANGSSRFAED